MDKAIVLAIVLASSGCAHTLSQDAVQANPLVVHDKTLRTSERITIVTRDIDLNNQGSTEAQGDATHDVAWPLVNTASWTMVTSDNLRFHVQVDHKWADYANIGEWTAVLEDDQGHTYAPVAIEHVRTRLLATLGDRQERITPCTNSGRVGEGYCRGDAGFFAEGMKDHSGPLAVYRGNADIVFQQGSLLTPSVRWLKLTMHHGTQRFEYVWKFQNDVANR